MVRITVTSAGVNIGNLLEVWTSPDNSNWTLFSTQTKATLISGYEFTPPIGTQYYQVRDIGSCGSVLELSCTTTTTTTAATTTTTTTAATTTTSTTAATTTTSTTVATTTTSTTAATTTTTTTAATTTTSTTPATTTTSTTPPTTTTTTTGGIGTTTTTTTETHILLSPVYWAANSTDLCDGTYDIEITNLYSNDPLITTLVDGESCYVDEFGNSYDEYTFDGYVTQVLGGLSVGEFTAPSLWQETVICPTTTTTTTAATTTTTTTAATTTTTTTVATTTTTTTAAIIPQANCYSITIPYGSESSGGDDLYIRRILPGESTYIYTAWGLFDEIVDTGSEYVIYTCTADDDFQQYFRYGETGTDQTIPEIQALILSYNCTTENECVPVTTTTTSTTSAPGVLYVENLSSVSNITNVRVNSTTISLDNESFSSFGPGVSDTATTPYTGNMTVEVEIESYDSSSSIYVTDSLATPSCQNVTSTGTVTKTYLNVVISSSTNTEIVLTDDPC